MDNQEEDQACLSHFRKFQSHDNRTQEQLSKEISYNSDTSPRKITRFMR